MAGDTLGEVIRRLSRFGGLQGDLAQTDAQLLERLARRREEPAFAALLARHGPMVLGLCRRLLHDPRDAEDAFQGAFLILARKAGAIRRQALLSAWLYGVAWRVAVRLRGRIARRRARERPVLDLDALPADDAAWSDVRWVVHEEVQRLPDVYRSAIVLCCLEGKTNEEAARLLRRPVGTVKSRLTRARELLRTRLTRRGMVVSVSGLGAVLAAHAATASAALVDATVRAALPFAAGGVVAGGVVSARAVALSQGVLRTMFLKKVTFAAAVALSVVLFGGVGGLAYHSWAAAPIDAPKEGAKVEKPPAADQPKDGATKDPPKDDGDAQKIQGTWVVVSMERDGKAMPPEASSFITITITDDKVAFFPPGFLIGRSPYKLDQAKTPKAIELTPPDGPWKGTTVHCLYKLDGDDLKLCFQTGLGEEPKEFATTPGSNLRLLVLKRKPADKPKDDKEALQGVWRVESVQVAGEEVTAQALAIRGIGGPREWVVKDAAVLFPNGATERSCPFKLDPDKTPKEIDITPMLPGYTRSQERGPPNRGVYSLDGDVWKVCFPAGTNLAQSGGEDVKRPKEVASLMESAGTPPAGTILFTLKRVKPNQDKPKEEQTALQGAWRLVAVEVGGKEAADKLFWKEWVVRGDFIDGRPNDVPEGVEVLIGSFALRPDANPKEIDVRSDPLGLLLDFNPYGGLHRNREILKGLYTLDGDVWKVCLPNGPTLGGMPPDQPTVRPKEMAAQEDGKTVVYTFKRVK